MQDGDSCKSSDWAVDRMDNDGRVIRMILIAGSLEIFLPLIAAYHPVVSIWQACFVPFSFSHQESPCAHVMERKRCAG